MYRDYSKILLKPKTLSLSHEKNILKEFGSSDVVHMRGERLGSYLAIFTGIDFDSLTTIRYENILELDSRRKVLALYRDNIKPGFYKKTGDNLVLSRCVPLFYFLVKRLEKRYEALVNVYGSDAQFLRIVSAGNDYITPANPDDVAHDARAFLFSTVPSEEKEDFELLMEYLSGNGNLIDMKDPTLLIKKTYATHLHNLDLSNADIEYILGLRRSEGDSWEHINRKLEVLHDYFYYHPYNAAFKGEEYWIESTYQFKIAPDLLEVIKAIYRAYEL